MAFSETDALEQLIEYGHRRREWAAARFEGCMRTLGANLAQAARYCRAFRIGFDQGFNATGEGFNGEYAPRLTGEGYEALATEPRTPDAWQPKHWRPGCGREAL